MTEVELQITSVQYFQTEVLAQPSLSAEGFSRAWGRTVFQWQMSCHNHTLCACGSTNNSYKALTVPHFTAHSALGSHIKGAECSDGLAWAGKAETASAQASLGLPGTPPWGRIARENSGSKREGDRAAARATGPRPRASPVVSQASELHGLCLLHYPAPAP